MSSNKEEVKEKKKVRKPCSHHNDPEVGKYYIECPVCGYLRIEVKQETKAINSKK